MSPSASSGINKAWLSEDLSYFPLSFLLPSVILVLSCPLHNCHHTRKACNHLLAGQLGVGTMLPEQEAPFQFLCQTVRVSAFSHFFILIRMKKYILNKHQSCSSCTSNSFLLASTCF